MKTMYSGKAFSPIAYLKNTISASDTIIAVDDISAFPDAPNLASIWDNAGNGETVLYTAKTSTALSGCTRGYEGKAVEHSAGSFVSRAYDNADHKIFIDNILELNENKVEKEPGKGLSANDFTANYKQKLDSLDTTLSGIKPLLTSVSINSTEWLKEPGGYTKSIVISGSTPKTSIDVLDSSQLSEFMTVHEITAIYVENSSGNISVHIRMADPEAAITTSVALNLRAVETR